MLRMIAAVADAPSATAAAARLNITPSALSHQIRDTEAALRVTLFKRVGRRLSLTPLGEQLLASARIVMDEVERAEEFLERSRRSEKPSLRLGGGVYPVHRWLLPLMANQEGALPHIDFISNTKAYPLARAVAQGELDLAFAAGDQRERSVTATPLFEDDLVAVFSSSHRLARMDFVNPSHLVHETYITYSRVIESGLEDDLLFKPARLAPVRIQETSSLDAILDLVAAGLGFSILSSWAVTSSPNRELLAIRPLTANGIRVNWSMLTRHSKQGDSELTRFLGLMKLVDIAPAQRPTPRRILD